MDKIIIKFDDTEKEEYEFHQHKSPISIKDIDINEIVVSHRLPFCKQDFKYFIGYKGNKKIRSLSILLPEWVYLRNFLIKLNVYILWQKDKKNVDNYMKIWEKVSNKMTKKLKKKKKKKKNQHRCFPLNFAKFFRTPS